MSHGYRLDFQNLSNEKGFQLESRDPLLIGRLCIWECSNQLTALYKHKHISVFLEKLWFVLVVEVQLLV